MKYLFLIFFCVSSLFASIGKISAVVGDAFLQRSNETIKVVIGLDLEEKDIITTTTNSKVQLIFSDNTIITLGRNSALDIATYLYDLNNPKDSKTDFNFFKGAFKTITGKIGKINKEKFKLRTKSASIGIRGTVILGSQTVIACTQGAISVFSEGKRVDVNANQLTRTEQNQPPSQAQTITNEDITTLESSLEPDKKTDDAITSNDDSKQSNDNDSDNTEEDNQNSDSSNESKDTAEDVEGNSNTSSTEDEKTTLGDDSSSSNATSDSNVQSNSQLLSSDDVSAIDDVVEDTTEEAVAFESGTVVVNSITDDNIMTQAESKTTVTISGTASGGDISEGDEVRMRINGTLYKTTVNNGSWSVNVDGDDLYNDPNSKFKVRILSTNSSGEVGTSFTRPTYSLATIYKPKGYLLGAYYDSASSSQSFIQTDSSFESERELKLFSFDETVSRERQSDKASSTPSVKGEITATSNFTTPTKGGYTGKSELGTITLDYTLDNGSALQAAYNVVADNMGEFFVVYHDGNVSGTTEFNELIVVGTDTPSSNLDSSKIYVYKDFKFLTAEKSGGTSLSSTKITTDSAFEYYNEAVGSLTHLNTNVYEKGAESFISGDGTTIKAYSNEYEYNSSTGNFVQDVFGSATGTTAIKGTDAQGLAISVSSTDKYKYGTSTESTYRETQSVGASFRETNTLDATTSGNLTYTGFTAFLLDDETLDNSAVDTQLTDDFSLTINRTNGTVSGEINKTQANTIPKLNLSGTVSSNKSYYINDDLFGVIGVNGSYVNGADTYGLLENTGYLIAVPDGFDSITGKMFDANDNPIFNDDDSSWGYWTAQYDVGDKQKFVSPYSTWVAGIQTAAGVISGLDTTKTYTFNGKVLGFVETNSGIEAIQVDANNTVIMKFDFGSGTMPSSTIDFKSATTSWDLDVNSTTVNSTSFSGNLSGTATYTNPSTAAVSNYNIKSASSPFSGKYFGDGELKSVGGNFKSVGEHDAGTLSDIKAHGVFKAK